MMDPLAQLEKLYTTIERRYGVTKGAPELAEATQFRSNRNRPIHGWFPFKEGFAAGLLDTVGIDTTDLLKDETVFLDPFCGSGTTLVAGDIDQKWQARRVGIEINPFLAFLSKTKTAWRNYRPGMLRSLAKKVLAEPLREDLNTIFWPNYSTFHNEQMFSSERVSALVDVVSRIKRFKAPERDLLLLGVAAAAERVSFYRKDGRALRILRSSGLREERRRLGVKETLQQIWTAYEMDLRDLQNHRNRAAGECILLNGDGRLLEIPENHDINHGQVSLIAYSPPYLNHIDYTEVYKVELWLLGFVKTQEEMLALRKRTLRSHASISIEDTMPKLPSDVARALEVATSVVTDTGKKWHGSFRNLTRAYLTDIHQALERQYALLRPGRRAVCVIGNSAHGSCRHRVPIATDLFISSLADSLGFEVEQFLVARQLLRRDHLNRFLRESVLVLRRPESS